MYARELFAPRFSNAPVNGSKDIVLPDIIQEVSPAVDENEIFLKY
jgi:hypothetical protein